MLNERFPRHRFDEFSERFVTTYIWDTLGSRLSYCVVVLLSTVARGQRAASEAWRGVGTFILCTFSESHYNCISISVDEVNLLYRNNTTFYPGNMVNSTQGTHVHV